VLPQVLPDGAPQRWTLAFRDPAREAEFMLAFGRDVRRVYQASLVAVLVLWTAAVGLDVAAPASSRTEFLIIRFGWVTPILLGTLVLSLGAMERYLRWWHTAALFSYANVLGGVTGLAVFGAPGIMDYVVGGFLLTVLTGAGFGIARAVHVIAVAGVMSAAMIATLAWSPHVPPRDLAVDSLWIIVALGGAAVITVQAEAARRTRFVQGALLERERRRTETLLANLLPEPIAARLKDGPKVIADGLDEVTVLFADLKGFSGLATEITPEQLVERLDRVFSAFDELAREHGLEKIKTMGDAYMAVAGAPFARADHARCATAMALEMIERLAALEPQLALRVGLASGPVVAGVIGRSKQSYDLWGETVNLASRMESHGLPGRVQVAERTRELIGDAFEVESRGAIDLKGIGPKAAFVIVAR
jgi:class 3 adenylate cyclase